MFEQLIYGELITTEIGTESEDEKIKYSLQVLLNIMLNFKNNMNYACKDLSYLQDICQEFEKIERYKTMGLS